MEHCFLHPLPLVQADLLISSETGWDILKPGQKSPVSHLLETSSQITWKISLEVNIINHISYPFLKSMFIEK